MTYVDEEKIVDKFNIKFITPVYLPEFKKLKERKILIYREMMYFNVEYSSGMCDSDISIRSISGKFNFFCDCLKLKRFNDKKMNFEDFVQYLKKYNIEVFVNSCYSLIDKINEEDDEFVPFVDDFKFYESSYNDLLKYVFNKNTYVNIETETHEF